MSENPYKIVEPSPLKQFGLSLLLGIAAAAIAYKISDTMAKPDTLVATGHASRGAFQFVWYVTALAGGAVFLLTMTIYKKVADKKYRESLGPPKAHDRALAATSVNAQTARCFASCSSGATCSLSLSRTT